MAGVVIAAQFLFLKEISGKPSTILNCMPMYTEPLHVLPQTQHHYSSSSPRCSEKELTSWTSTADLPVICETRLGCASVLDSSHFTVVCSPSAQATCSALLLSVCLNSGLKWSSRVLSISSQQLNTVIVNAVTPVGYTHLISAVSSNWFMINSNSYTTVTVHDQDSLPLPNDMHLLNIENW